MAIFHKVMLVVVMTFVCSGLARADSVNNLLSPGKLISGHAKYDNECDKCHKPYDKAAQSGLCRDCHKEVSKDINEKRRYHGLMKKEKACKECHGDHKGRDARIAKLDTIGFDHETTGYPLKGAHTASKVLCKDCHSPLKKYREAPTKCIACHEKADKHKGSLGKDCESCHEEKDWKTFHYDHSKSKFDLQGKHKEVKCKSCHVKDKYKDTPRLCSDCHKKDDDGEKGHKGKFGPKCETCHTDREWKEIIFDHDKKTKYPLLGKHKETKCTECHKGVLYKEKLKKECVACHKKDDDKEKGHKGKFGSKCETCHIEKGWKEIPFDHDKKTKYPLLGKHKDAKCSDCHKGNLYKDKLKKECVACHKKDDDKEKGHKGKFGDKCETCHIEKGWKEIVFDHDKKTKYRLLGKHKETKCVACHKGDLYKDKLKKDCYSCHKKDDKHEEQQGKKCESCHDEKDWKKASFNHSMSKYPLTGRHILTECKKCHATPRFKDAKSDCWSCHEKKDSHKKTLGTNCEKCHNTRDWKSWDFDHDRTNFKLQGKHKDLKCADCHHRPVDGKISMAASCVACHDKDDKHVGAFGRRCEQCHVGSSWKKIKDSAWKEIRIGSQRWTNK
ncbi:MAG: cytochrome C [Gammaproteobacteria bacterium]|nr:cytochrome C [Gammaproteobacteria bacterium]MBU1776618.1 cytochrome C [Gammaproteobacteria bacterium]MBU1968198.1 cytochrome C [Gammaproteobacteria bacterium]